MRSYALSIRRFVFVVPGIAGVVAACWLAASCAAAADPAFVGVLALAVDDEVSQQLGLTENQKQQLLDLIDTREEEVLETALELRELPASERAEKLAPFRRESESKGLELLSAQQRHKLEQIRIRRLGVAALAEPAIAGRLNLTAQQRVHVGELLQQQAKRLAGVDEQAGRVIRAETKHSLTGVLSEEQQVALRQLTSETPAEGPPGDENGIAAGSPQPVEPEASESPAVPGEAEPAESLPAQPAQAEPEEPPEGEPAETAEEKPGKLRFNFRFQPWEDVLDWFARQADLSLVLDAPPPGTLNYTDNREYTPHEAIDLLNSVLLTKGYTLVRRDRMLMLINLEDGVPPNLVSTIPLEELDKRGEYELVSVLFQLEKVTPEEAELELQKLVGPQGSVVPLPKAQQVLVTETAGRLRTIRDVIQRIEDPEGLISGQLQTFELDYITPEEALDVLRQLLDIPSDQNAAPDGSIRFALDPSGTKLLASGKSDKLARVGEILEAVDVPGLDDLELGGIDETPQLEVYSIATADPESVLQVMQTLLAGLPDVRLAIDSKTGNLIALARPGEHATIKATLQQMQRDAQRVEVIHLRSVDPQLAVLSINKLFGAGGEGSGTAPKVDADPSTRQLLVRGNEAQIEQIRALLEKMGETGAEELDGTGGGNVRMLPLSGRAAKSALERIQQIWPTMRNNRIRVVTPSAVIPTLRPGSPAESSPPPDALFDPFFNPGALIEVPATAPPSAEDPKTEPPAPEEPLSDQPTPEPPAKALPPVQPVSPGPSPTEAKSAAATPAPPGRGKIFFAVQTTQPEAEPDSSEPSEEPVQTAPAEPVNEPAPIIVTLGPGGLMIASQDIEALDDFEQLLTTLAGSEMMGNNEMTIFYLKHAKATVVAEILDQIFGGGTTTSSSSAGGSGGGSLFGDLAGAALGDMGGGVLGSLLGLGGDGGSISPTGSMQITPDTRLNALIVQANPADLDTIEQLLKILDQKESPEDVLVRPKPKLIPVFNTQAEEIAEIVKQVYQDRMTSTSSRGQQPTPQEFIQMLRGGRRSGGGSQRGSTDDVQKMSIGVDPRTNSVIVSAPEPLFEEVKQLVEQLDQAAIESNQAVRVITLHRANPNAVQQALSALTGNAVQFGKTGSQPGSSGGRPQARPGSTPAGSPSSAQQQQMMQRMQFLRSMQQRGGTRSGGPRR